MSWTMAQSFDGAGCPCIGELTRISLPKAIRVRFDWKFGLVCLGFALLSAFTCFFLFFFFLPWLRWVYPGSWCIFSSIAWNRFYNFLKIQSKYCIRRWVPKAQRELFPSLSFFLFPSLSLSLSFPLAALTVSTKNYGESGRM